MRDPSVLDPKIRAYLEAENDYVKAALAHTEPLQEALFAEMKGRIKEDDSTVPSPDGPYAYYMRYREGGQHPILCRQPRDGGAEQDAARRRRARGRQGLLPARRNARIRPTTGCSHGRPTTRARRSTRCACAISPPASDLPDDHSRRRGLDRVDRGFIRLLLRAARCQSPALARLSPSARHAGGGRHARLRGDRTAASSSRSGELQSGRFADDFGARSRDIRMLAGRSGDPGREAAACRAARNTRCSTTSSITRTGTAKRRW